MTSTKSVGSGRPMMASGITQEIVQEAVNENPNVSIHTDCIRYHLASIVSQIALDTSISKSSFGR